MASLVTYKYIKQNPDIMEYIRRADKTLEAMARLKPKDIREFMLIPGVSQKKAEKYGKIFIDHINKQ